MRPFFFLPQDAVGQAQDLTQGPGLKRAAARRVRWVAVGDFGDRPEAGIIEVPEKRFEETNAGLVLRLGRSTADPDPRLHEGPDQPRPDSSLMVRSVTLSNTPFITRGISRRARCQGPKSQRRPKMDFHCIDEAPGLLAF